MPRDVALHIRITFSHVHILTTLGSSSFLAAQLPKLLGLLFRPLEPAQALSLHQRCIHNRAKAFQKGCWTARWIAYNIVSNAHQKKKKTSCRERKGGTQQALCSIVELSKMLPFTSAFPMTHNLSERGPPARRFLRPPLPRSVSSPLPPGYPQWIMLALLPGPRSPIFFWQYQNGGLGIPWL